MEPSRPTPPSRWRIPFVARILIAMVLGMVLGRVLGERAEPLKVLGDVILNMIKGLAGPLLLFAVLDAFLRTPILARSGGPDGRDHDDQRGDRDRHRPDDLERAPARTGSEPASPPSDEARAGFEAMTRSVSPERRIDFFGDLLALVPTSVVRPFLDNAILSIVFLAVLGGAALRRVKTEQMARGQDDYLAVERFVATVYRAVEIALAWVITLVPVAVFGVVAQTVGKWGLEPLRGLAVYVGVGMLGLAIQVFVVYGLWLTLVARVSPRRFWSGASEPVVYAMGTGSSLATLPVTLRGLDRMGVSPQSARMAACVGTNLNNDGILLYEAMAVLFVAQACGVHLTLPEQLVAAASCVIAGIGISGIPEAGLISLLLVLKTVKVVPDEQVALVVPLLLTVDWVLGRCRAMTNVTSDMLVAVLLDRFEEGRETEPTPAGWAEDGVTTDADAGLAAAFPSAEPPVDS